MSRSLHPLLRPRHALEAGLIAFLLLATAFAIPAATVREAWVQRYNSLSTNSFDQALQMARDSDGNIIVTGVSNDRTQENDVLTLKYSGATGALLWKQVRATTARDQPTGLTVDRDGNILLTWWSSSSGWGFINESSFVTKFAPDGSLLWEKSFESIDPYAYAASVAVNANGDVLVTGHSIWVFGFLDPINYYTFCTAKFSSTDGTLLWEVHYNGDTPNIHQQSFGAAVAVDAAGDVIVTGSSQNTTPPNYSLDFYTAKYSGTTGDLVWEERATNLDGLDSRPVALALDPQNNVVVTGTFPGPSGLDFYAIKYASSGGWPLWETRYDSRGRWSCPLGSPPRWSRRAGGFRDRCVRRRTRRRNCEPFPVRAPERDERLNMPRLTAH